MPAHMRNTYTHTLSTACAHMHMYIIVIKGNIPQDMTI